MYMYEGNLALNSLQRLKCHKTKRNETKEEQYILQLKFWLVQSVDLNPIELVWDELNRKVRAKQHTSTTHLWQL